MKQLVVLSGKGGTGKTSVAAALAELASRELSLVLADADVDAANLELVLRPTRLEEHCFFGGQGAVLDNSKCTGCGRCAEVCRFDAVEVREGVWSVDALACEGCAACLYVCPSGVISLHERQAGLWYRSQTRFGPLYHARLFAAQENSGKLVTLVKSQARADATSRHADLMVVDGPPGIGCPVIAASAGADLALLVTEPTASGVHDLARVLETLAHFHVPAMVCINKEDLDKERSETLAAWCREHKIAVAGRLPYDDAVIAAMVRGDPVTSFGTRCEVSKALEEVWARVKIAL